MYQHDDLRRGDNGRGIRFEYILFDDCFMSSIEVAYDLRKITRHLIASPCEVMAYGYPYDLVMPYLFTDGGHGIRPGTAYAGVSTNSTSNTSPEL